MNHLFIIFSENGKLHQFCEELVNNTHIDILKGTKMCFLNGKQVHLPLADNDSIDESGVLLVYDAHNNAAHDKDKTLSALQNISTKYRHLYVCYHARSAEEWKEEVSNLNLTWTNEPITKSHYDAPYSFLNEFHQGLKTIDDLISFWHSEEIKEENNSKCSARRQLIYAVDESYIQEIRYKKFQYLESTENIKLVADCRLTEIENHEYQKLKKSISQMVDENSFSSKLSNFKTLILSEC